MVYERAAEFLKPDRCESEDSHKVRLFFLKKFVGENEEYRLAAAPASGTQVRDVFAKKDGVRLRK